MSPPERHAAILDVLTAAQALKDTRRSGRTAAGRPEDAAGHSWGVCLLAVLMEPDLSRAGEPPVDMARLLRLCILHDLAEAICGDVPAPAQSPDDGRADTEAAAFAAITAPLPPDLRDALRGLWKDYADATSPEARLAKGLDRIETMVQHVGGAQAPGFDHLWNLGYGREWTDAHPALAGLRGAVDDRTRARARS